MKLKIYKIIFSILIVLAIALTILIILKYAQRYKVEEKNKEVIETFLNIDPTEEQSILINGYRVIGKIKISKINIEYPILDIDKYNPENMKAPMKTSIVKYWGNGVNDYGNLSVAGHNNYDGTMFGRLKKLQIGDVVELENLKKEKVNYKVYSIFVTNPNDVNILQGNDDIREVTMITCTNGNKNRLIVKAIEI